jgi:hypothetical protein
MYDNLVGVDFIEALSPEGQQQLYKLLYQKLDAMQDDREQLSATYLAAINEIAEEERAIGQLLIVLRANAQKSTS